MNEVLMEELLNEEESATLDFKRDQYPFAGATDEQKSELLKDILAFANAWRRTDAYILIGIDEVKGGRSKVEGVTNHLNDNDLQQFVLSKANRPLTFSYEAFSFESKQVGVIKIPVQQRPFFIKKKFGRLEPNVVYIRRSSSTGIADLDEVAKMGAPISGQILESPKLELQFANVENKILLGRDIEITSTVIDYDKSQIKSRHYSPFEATAYMYNKDFEIEMAKYIAVTSAVRPIGFHIKNTSSILAGNVRLEINTKREKEVTVFDEIGYPLRPRRNRMSIPNILNPNIRVESHRDNWRLVAQFGNIQPKASKWSNRVFYIGAMKPLKLEFEAVIYADNLPEPISVPLSINILTETKYLNTDFSKMD